MGSIPTSPVAGAPDATPGGARGPKGGPFRALGALISGFLLLGILHGCGEPQYQYVSNRKVGNFFRLPSSWATRDITAEQYEGRLPADRGQNVTVWDLLIEGPRPAGGGKTAATVGREALDDPLSSLLSPNVRGRVQAIDLGFGTKEGAALSGVRAFFSVAGVDPLFPPEDFDGDRVEVAAYEPLQFGDSLTGSRVVANVDLDGGRESSLWVTESQSMVLDIRSGFVYVLYLRCSAECYEKNKQQIDEIATSFTVRK